MGQSQPKLKSTILSNFSSDQIDVIRRQNVSNNQFNLFENGIDADYYPLEESLSVDSSDSYFQFQGPSGEIKQFFLGVLESKVQDQVDYAKPKLSDQSIIEKFPQTKIISDDEFLLNCFDNSDYILLYLTNYHWIHSHFPHDEIMDYTGTILTNDSIKGLQHTFVRHWDQWIEHIPGLEQIMEKLKFIILDLENIKNANNVRSAYKAVNLMVESLDKMDNNDLLEIKCTLLEAQFEIFKFLKNNLTSNTFLSNDHVKGRLYFDVQDLDGNKRVMVVCLSRELFPVVEEFTDPRQVRLIITIYFLTEQEFLDL